jgi:hypothetical protein
MDRNGRIIKQRKKLVSDRLGERRRNLIQIYKIIEIQKCSISLNLKSRRMLKYQIKCHSRSLCQVR